MRRWKPMKLVLASALAVAALGWRDAAHAQAGCGDPRGAAVLRILADFANYDASETRRQAGHGALVSTTGLLLVPLHVVMNSHGPAARIRVYENPCHSSRQLRALAPARSFSQMTIVWAEADMDAAVVQLPIAPGLSTPTARVRTCTSDAACGTAVAVLHYQGNQLSRRPTTVGVWGDSEQEFEFELPQGVPPSMNPQGRGYNHGRFAVATLNTPAQRGMSGAPVFTDDGLVGFVDLSVKWGDSVAVSELPSNFSALDQSQLAGELGAYPDTFSDLARRARVALAAYYSDVEDLVCDSGAILVAIARELEAAGRCLAADATEEQTACSPEMLAEIARLDDEFRRQRDAVVADATCGNDTSRSEIGAIVDAYLAASAVRRAAGNLVTLWHVTRDSLVRPRVSAAAMTADLCDSLDRPRWGRLAGLVMNPVERLLACSLPGGSPLVAARQPASRTSLCDVWPALTERHITESTLPCTDPAASSEWEAARAHVGDLPWGQLSSPLGLERQTAFWRTLATSQIIFSNRGALAYASHTDVAVLDQRAALVHELNPAIAELVSCAQAIGPTRRARVDEALSLLATTIRSLPPTAAAALDATTTEDVLGGFSDREVLRAWLASGSADTRLDQSLVELPTRLDAVIAAFEDALLTLTARSSTRAPD